MSTGMKRAGIQTWAMFADAYRELNSKKLFWISLGISGLVVVIMGLLGIDEEGISIGPWHLGFGMLNSSVLTPGDMYKQVFVNLGIGVWLSWASVILALVSTAGMFPEFLANGAIDVLLSKPIGRMRLFLTKYLTGLMFVGLQVLAFTLASFLVIGIRGGVWEFGLFVAVPLVTLVFSYLFGVMVLVGVLTRSTIASLLITGIVWFVLFLANSADGIVVHQHEFQLMRVEAIESKLRDLPADSTRRARTEEDLEKARSSAETWGLWATGMRMGKTVLPKTTETVDVISRVVRSSANLPESNEESNLADRDLGPMGARMSDRDQRALQKRLEERFRARPLWWVLGTSVAFEAVVVGIAAGLFVRRDF
ncbi:MAG: ABC transporter permease [Phycisphaerales bacterium]